MKGARKLRCLVIHDTTFTPETNLHILGTGDVDLCALYDADGAVAKVVKSWVDVCEILIGDFEGRTTGHSPGRCRVF